MATYPSNTIIKFVEDTTVAGLISNNNETLQRGNSQVDRVVYGQ